MNKISHLNLHLGGLVLLAFLFPYVPLSSSPVIGFLFLSLIVSLFTHRLPIHWSWLLKSAPFWALFVVYAASLLYTSDIDNGVKTLETKLSLALFPLIMLPLAGASPKFRQLVRTAFIVSCAAILVACILVAAANYWHDYKKIRDGLWNYGYGINWFISSRLSIFLHPSYLSMYFNLALFFLVRSEFSQTQTLLLKPWQRRVLMVFLAVGTALLASKAGYLFLLIVAVYGLWGMMRTGNRKLAIGLVALGVVMGTGIFLKAPEIVNRMKNAGSFFQSGHIEPASTESNAIRTLVWRQAVLLAQDHPVTGVGIGDVNAELLKRYQANGITGAAEKKLNSHSQFLQTQLAAGIVASLLLIWSILLFFLRRPGNGTLFFGSLIALNFAVEAMLETQAGNIFFGFWGIFLLYESIDAKHAPQQ